MNPRNALRKILQLVGDDSWSHSARMLEIGRMARAALDALEAEEKAATVRTLPPKPAPLDEVFAAPAPPPPEVTPQSPAELPADAAEEPALPAEEPAPAANNPAPQGGKRGGKARDKVQKPNPPASRKASR